MIRPRLAVLATLVFAALFTQADAARGPADREIAELMRLQAAARQAHMTYDAALLVATQDPDFISVNAGTVSRPSVDESRRMFESYFSSVRFVAWDDLAAPRITLSQDGRMAVIVVEKYVHLVARTGREGRPPQEVRRRFAWVETWRKRPQGWRLAIMASTDSPWTGDPPVLR